MHCFDGRLGIEEIIVTGTKRDISTDVPIAVSTITEQQLENTFRNDAFALGQLAPNVTLTPQNGFNAIAGGMRGTGFISILVTKDPSVGIVVDDFAFNHVQAQAMKCLIWSRLKFIVVLKELLVKIQLVALLLSLQKSQYLANFF